MIVIRAVLVGSISLKASVIFCKIDSYEANLVEPDYYYSWVQPAQTTAAQVRSSAKCGYKCAYLHLFF